MWVADDWFVVGPECSRRDPMPSKKFGERDRRVTIMAVEEHFGVQLTEVRSRQKYLAVARWGFLDRRAAPSLCPEA
jgi:hypothetical protein